MKNTDLLVGHARAIQSAQRLEVVVKIVLCLLRAYHDRARGPAVFTEEEFFSRRAQAKEKTLGQAWKNVLDDYSMLNVPALPDDFVSEMRQLVGIRNYLAHSYFPDNYSLFQSEDGRQFLAGELAWFSTKLEEWIPVFEKLAEVVEKGLGGTWKEKTNG